MLFERTGGTHSAVLRSRTPLGPGSVVIVREDIDRHNAPDKAVGAAAIPRVSLERPLLFLWGRRSLEMVAKAARPESACLPVSARTPRPMWKWPGGWG